MIQRRPYSAPISLLSKKLHSAQEKQKRVLKDFQLSPWNNEPTSPRKDCKKLRESKNLGGINLKSFSSALNFNPQKPTASSNNNHGTKYKSSKWYMRAAKESQLDFDCSFQHFTDTSQYIRHYREQKMIKIHQVYSEEIKTLLNNQVCPVHDLSAHVVDNTRYQATDNSKNNNNPPTQQLQQHFYKKNFDSTLTNYRLEGGKVYEEKLWRNGNHFKGRSEEQTEEKRKYNNRKGKDFKGSGRQRNLSLPKCQSVFISSKSTLSNGISEQHPLQCRKLSELTIHKAPQRHFGATKKLRSAEERKRASHKIPSSPSLSVQQQQQQQQQSDYNHIMRRVLGHYDPSKNQFRANNMSSHRQQQQQQGGLLAAT